MGYPNESCMAITIYVHHMQTDELYDFLNDRIEEPPPYWYSMEYTPYSVTGGTISYGQYQKIRTARSWQSPL